MTEIKLCGLSRIEDIDVANELKPEYIGFVFAPKSKRYITPETAARLKHRLVEGIAVVGVFVDESPETIADLLNNHIIDIAQLHGHETDKYIQDLRALTDKPVIKAFKVDADMDLTAVESSIADYILLDSGAGTGTVFNWKLIENIKRPFFLAGGLSIENIGEAIQMFHPYAVDVSSGIETNGLKDRDKMNAFISTVRKEG